MAVRTGTHPLPEALRGFAAGHLDDRSAAAVMSHLDGCSDCCQKVADLSADDFLGRLRLAHSHGSTPGGLLDGTLVTHPPANGVADDSHALVSDAGFSLADRPSGEPAAGPPSEPDGSPQYEILRELGRGGMGVVYLARNKLMDRLEVLKVVNPALLHLPGAVGRFLVEIRSAARLSHPNVVAAYSAVRSGGRLAFAMEYVEGDDLARLVEADGPLPVARACDYARQAALGLQHAFERGMVHRDIKPQNLILQRAGDTPRVKILDFGLAKLASGGEGSPQLTAANVVLGTPSFIAPEQTVDAAHADIRADIYSLGCTLYFLLTGAPPFVGRSRYDIMLLHRSAEPSPLGHVRPDIPDGLAAVVRKMMAKDPARRYQTPAAVAVALAPFLGRESTGSGRGRRFGVIAAGVLLFALLGVAAGVVFRVKTSEGTLVVEVDVPNPDVYVDGAQVDVRWDDGGKKGEIRIRPGASEVKVTKDGFTAHGERVTLEEGKRRLVQARLEPTPTPPNPKAKPPTGEGSRAGEERDDNALKMTFCWCPARAIPGDARSPGIHAQGFHLSGFWMGRYEVTQAAWKAVMGEMPSHPLDKGKGDRHPIYHVSHDDATLFCRKLTAQERTAGRLPDGWEYRLPTEVQWEYACRAGTTTATAFGDLMDSTQANFNGDFPQKGAAKGPNLGKAVAVGSYKPNAWGLYDMHGNVGEWAALPGRHHGGSWYDSGRNCESNVYIPDRPDASEHVGFRVALVKD